MRLALHSAAADIDLYCDQDIYATSDQYFYPNQDSNANTYVYKDPCSYEHIHS
jgi:hypothetical protein